MSTMGTRSMLWCLCLILSLYQTQARFEIIEGDGKYPTIVMNPAAKVPTAALTKPSGRNLQLAASIGSRNHASDVNIGSRNSSPRNLPTKGYLKKAKTPEDGQDDFIETLQSMVTGDIVNQHSKALKESKYRKLDTAAAEDNPFVWKFFIRPGDLEELLTSKTRLKNFSSYFK